MFSIEAIPCLTALPLQARLGLLFLFLPISGFSQPPLSEWRRTGFLSPWVGHCPRIRSQLGHTPPTGLVWGLGGVAFPTPPSNRPRIVAQGRVLFSPQNELTPPPKGGGAGYRFSWVRSFLTRRSPVLFRRKRRMLRIRGLLSTVAFGNRWPQLAHTGPTRRVCCFSGVVPLPGSHNRTQGRTGPNLVSPSFLGVLLLRKSR